MNHRILLCLPLITVIALIAFCLGGPNNNRVWAVVNPQSGSLGIEGTVPSPPPTQAPTISTPSNGQVFTSTPITVTGLCTKGLLVKVFSNNVFVGSTQCPSGSYSIQIDLFSGRNDLYAEVFDALDQSSPNSNVVTVTFNSPAPLTSAALLFITSNYAERGANPGQKLTWPVTLSGGTGPFAIGIDWGDGTPTDIMSEQYGGTITLSHVYNTAGTYNITIKATDKNGELAFLQLVGVANGAITSNPSSKKNSNCTLRAVEIIWIPAALTILLLPVAFWLGRRYELSALRRHLERL